MINNNDYISITGKRLSGLRGEKGIPQDKLSDILSDKYNEHIVSRGSFQNYERLSKPENGGTTSNGMNAATLRILADFYGVSADYILGLTEKRTPDITVRGISDYTGIDEKNINDLHSFVDRISASDPKGKNTIDLINVFLNSLYIFRIATYFSEWLRQKEEAKNYFSKAIQSSNYDEAEKLFSYGEDLMQKADGSFSRLVNGIEAALRLSFNKTENERSHHKACRYIAELEKEALNNL